MPAVIVGGGRVGQALAEMGVEGDVIVRRGESFPSEPKTGPIFVATRNDVLEDVIKNTPPERREDLVFMQNGMLQTFLDAQGLGSNTQALIYFAVAAAGDKPTDGVTELNPEGLTAVTGKWADAVAARFHNGDLSCHVLDASTYEGSMYEKLIWICAMMLVGAQHEGAKVGDVATTYKDEVVGLIEELLSGTCVHGSEVRSRCCRSSHRVRENGGAFPVRRQRVPLEKWLLLRIIGESHRRREG